MGDSGGVGEMDAFVSVIRVALDYKGAMIATTRFTALCRALHNFQRAASERRINLKNVRLS
jgi:hypothetical protein